MARLISFAPFVLLAAIAGCSSSSSIMAEAEDVGAPLDAATPDTAPEDDGLEDPDAGGDPVPDSAEDVVSASEDAIPDASGPDSPRDVEALDTFAPDVPEDVSSPLDTGGDPPDVATPIDAGGCVVDTDCRLFSSYCAGTVLRPCRCLAIGATAPPPKCDGRTVRCFADPCGRHRAVCRRGTCRVAR